MNAATVAKWLNLSPERATALEKAWNVASTVAAGVHSKEDAMRVLAERNIGGEVLEKAAGYLDNPIADVAAKAAGINLDQMKNDINSLRGAQHTMSVPPAQQQDTQMDILRRGLQQLK